MAGVGGMLGEAFFKVFSEEGHELQCSDLNANEKWLSSLDFRDYDAYRKQVMKFRPDYIFHIGAYTDLEFCELNPKDTYFTNTLSVEHAVCLANELEIPILYISTAGIFDGAKDLYDDWDTPNPLGVYARSKYMGERYVVENAMRYFICRAGWMMGGGPEKDKKYISKIMKQIKDGSKSLNIVNDRDGTPTYTIDFAKTCHGLVQTEFYGLYNNLIYHDDLSSIWNMNDWKSLKTVAISQASKDSFLLGRQTWTISNDSSECSQEYPYTTDLKMTGCSAE